MEEKTTGKTGGGRPDVTAQSEAGETVKPAPAAPIAEIVSLLAKSNEHCQSALENIHKTLNDIRDVLIPRRRWWQAPWVKHLAVVLVGLGLLSIIDFRTPSDLTALEGTTVTLVALPPPNWKFPEYDEQTLAEVLPALQHFWSLPMLPQNVGISPVFEVSLVRSGVTYGTATICMTRSNRSNGEVVAGLVTPAGAKPLAINGPTEIRIFAFTPDDATNNAPLIRTYGLKLGNSTIPLQHIVDSKSGIGKLQVTTIPPPGVSRLQYNLEKVWKLFF